MKLNINDFEKAEEIDPLEAINYSDEARDIAESVGTGARNMDVPKAAPKAMPKTMPKAAAKQTARDTGSDMARMMNRAKAVPAPVDETKLSASERTKRSIEKNLSGARSGSGPTDRRSVTDRIKASFGMKSGGMTASSRGDGIAQRGKTRGKMC
jgi:hypothetical protein